MPRGLNAHTVVGMMEQQTAEIILVVVELDHDDYVGDPIRVVNNTEDITVNSVAYTGAAFEFVPPEDSEGSKHKASIRIDNTDNWLTPSIRSYIGPWTAHVRFVTAVDATALAAKEFDDVEIDYPIMEVEDIKWNAFNMEATLSYDNQRNEVFPGHSVDPFDFPGAF